MQSLPLPMEFMKVMIAMFRIHLEERRWMTLNGRYIDAKRQAVMSVAAVCRYWKRLVTSSNNNSRRQLGRLFRGK
jgi:hypothetical protein